MGQTKSTRKCTCNDQTQENTIKCVNDKCQLEIKKIAYYEKVFNCPLHHGVGMPPLCTKCKSEGYYVDREIGKDGNLITFAVKGGCTCYDETQERSVICFTKLCYTEWKIKLDFHERMFNCPVKDHNRGIVICGPTTPSVCEKCQADGYYVASDHKLGFPTFTLMRR